MEPRLSEQAQPRGGDWTAQDRSEHHNLKQVGLLMGFAPMATLLGALLFLTAPPPFPALRAMAFLLLLLGLAGLGMWFAAHRLRLGRHPR